MQRVDPGVRQHSLHASHFIFSVAHTFFGHVWISIRSSDSSLFIATRRWCNRGPERGVDLRNVVIQADFRVSFADRVEPVAGVFQFRSYLVGVLAIVFIKHVERFAECDPQISLTPERDGAGIVVAETPSDMGEAMVSALG